MLSGLGVVPGVGTGWLMGPSITGGVGPGGVGGGGGFPRASGKGSCGVCPGTPVITGLTDGGFGGFGFPLGGDGGGSSSGFLLLDL